MSQLGPRLPPVLADWALELELFSDTLLPAFVDWLPKLATLVGAMDRATPLGLGEPDGFDGVSQRGHYQRLLISEWLLADEAPLEFMRRAAMGQHMFRQLARHEPAESRCCVLVLDAGPSQLGGPRLAHLALLAVFARRTRRAHARLLWGVASDPATIHEGLDAGSIRVLLGGRSLDMLTSDRLAGWTRALAERGLEVAERWLVTDAAGGSIARSAGWKSRVAINEPLGSAEPLATRTVRVEVHEGASDRPRRSVELTLPDEATSVAILRGRAVVAAKVSERSDVVAITRGLALDPIGRGLLAWTASGGIVAYRIPKSRGDKGKTRHYEPTPGERVLGATMIGKRLITLTLCGGDLILRRFSKGGQDAIHRPEPKLADELVRESGALAGGQLIVQPNEVLYRSPSNSLIRMQRSTTTAEWVSDSVVAITQCGRARAWLAGQSLMYQFRRGVRDHLVVDLGELAPDGLVTFCSLFGDPALLFQRADGQYGVHRDGKTEFVLGPPEGMTVVGCVINTPTGSVPRLLVLDAQRRTLAYWFGAHGIRDIEVFDSDVVAITIGNTSRIVAVATRTGELWAYCMDQASTLLRMRVAVGVA